MSNKVLLLQDGAPVTAEGSATGQVLTWDQTSGTASFEAGASGTVTSVGLTSGTSGIVVGGSVSPITGAGTYNLDAPQRFAFDTASPIAPVAAGQMSWDVTEGSLNTMMVGGNVDAVVGQQLYQRVVNADSVTLTKGMVVYVFGSSGTRVTAKRATADADLTSATILGVVAESIAQNAQGFIITNGLLKDLSVLPSTTFADGDVVYLSPTTAGGLTPTKPVAPQHLVMVGYCVKASNGAAGVLLVHPQNGYELAELHDVYINSPTSGQILVYDATSGQTRWENASLGGSNGVAVTPGAGSLSVGLDTASSPTLTGLTLSGLTASRFVVTDASKNLASQQYVSLTSEVSGTLPAANGGTGQSSYTIGDLLYASDSSTLSKLAGVATGNALISGGVGTAPSWGKIDLTTHVSGVLPIANGGTNNGSLSVAIGSVYYGSGTQMTALAAGTSGQALQSGGAGAPSWVGYPYDLSAASAGTYSNSQTIFRHVAVRDVTITSTGSLFRSLAASSGTVTVTVQKNGVTAFSVTFSVAGGTTGSVPSGTTVTLAAGDVLTVVTPSTADATLAGVYFTLKATALGV